MTGWTPPRELVDAASELGEELICPPGRRGIWRGVLQELCDDIEAGERTSALFLCNNATETKAVQRAGRLGFDICLPRGRVKFLDEDGSRAYPIQGQMILYRGVDRLRFAELFERFGSVLFAVPLPDRCT